MTKHSTRIGSLPASTGGLATERASIIHHVDEADEQKPTLSVIAVNTLSLDSTSTWELADALVAILTESDVQKLTVVASLHLTQAKAHSVSQDNVYHAAFNVCDDRSPVYKQLDSTWEVKDEFLSSMMHFLRVDQSIPTHLVVAKGYKPGRDGAGTLDALQTLAPALETYFEGSASADVQAAHLDALMAQKDEDRSATSTHNLLYQ
ncbi:hypothetical protein Poli38472_007385 [Pythium oligandrum]|uniref:Uncharacterized protein n=1 Tax=Pythium oligandrum TaxID=41045 RepID=A0A8K1CAG3_PYTOL|nr:hypothetical protein Poli38472_007385 [Pythium oligandrum]|eukprot:TMW59240.1 hypothetical protein Poli38472_007385 [Pythium oligandrum]